MIGGATTDLPIEAFKTVGCPYQASVLLWESKHIMGHMIQTLSDPMFSTSKKGTHLRVLFCRHLHKSATTQAVMSLIWWLFIDIPNSGEV